MSARRTIGILAITQIASWGALYYAFAVLAPDIRRDLHISTETAFAVAVDDGQRPAGRNRSLRDQFGEIVGADTEAST